MLITDANNIMPFNDYNLATSTGISYDYINFISGQDYPIKSAEYMLNFFEQNKGKEFIEYESIEDNWLEALPRITKYHFVNFTFRGKYSLERFVNFFTPKRKLPGDLKPYGKSMFWMLSTDCAKYVVDYVESRPHLERFFLFTWGSDEFIFQTVLMNSEHKDKLVSNDFRYIDWSAGGSHPKTLNIQDFDALKSTDDLFARKFSANADSKLLDMLDQL